MTASLTAYNIVITLLNEGENSPYLNAFARFGADNIGKKLIRWLPASLHLKIMAIFFVPGMSAHFIARKKLIREQTEKAIANGIEQIVIVGAGFDILALTFAERHPNCRFMEMDLPGTQQQKQKALQLAGITLQKNTIFHPCDLSQSNLLEELKKIPSFSIQQPALFIFEGVLMYVPEAAVAETFRQIATLHNETLVLFGAMAKHDCEYTYLQRALSWLADSVGEVIYWVCPSTQMSQFMEQSGLSLREQWKYKEIQKSADQKIPEEDENYFLAGKKI